MGDFDKKFWEEAYQENADQVEVPDCVLNEEINDLPVSNALDIGCGIGTNAFKLAERGWQVVGIDISETAIEIARKEAVKRNVQATFHAVDSTLWDPPCQFDLVLSTYALPSGEGLKKALATAVKALCPGGTLIITEWDKSMDEVWEFMRDDLFSPKEIAEMLPELIIEKTEVVRFDNIFTPDDHRAFAGTWANAALVRAVKPD